MTAKVLYLNHAAYIGGAEVSLLSALRYLDKNSFLPVVLAPEGGFADALREQGICWRPIPVLDGLNRFTAGRFLRAIPALLACIRREHPDLLHANTNFATQYTGLLSLLTGIPAVGHIRDIEPLGRVGTWLMRQNTCLIAISDAVKTYLIRQGGVASHRIERIYNGVDLQQYQPVPETHSDSSQVVIGLIGQIGERKGQVYLLKAARMLIQRYPQVVFWFVGKEPEPSQAGYMAQLQQYVRDAQIDSHVKFWGFQADIPAMLANMDIAVLASLQEPFGRVVIEAMAMQKPVVATAVGGVPEIVADGVTGLLIPPADVDALAQALEVLILDREQRNAMGKQGRKGVEELFPLTKHVQHIQSLYHTILSGY
jgi:glycosyltransferase involved in cell wall biosynthesis